LALASASRRLPPAVRSLPLRRVAPFRS
jgi:hypothetical protein